MSSFDREDLTSSRQDVLRVEQGCSSEIGPDADELERSGGSDHGWDIRQGRRKVELTLCALGDGAGGDDRAFDDRDV